MNNKHSSENSLVDRLKSAENVQHSDLASLSFIESHLHQTARLIGQPEGPFGTACVSKNTVLLRSLGANRFSRFETAEIAPHGFFVAVSNLQNQPFKAKTTLVEFQLFLGDPQSPGCKIIKGIGRIEEIRANVEVPIPMPSGYIFKILQLSGQELADLERYVQDILLKAAM